MAAAHVLREFRGDGGEAVPAGVPAGSLQPRESSGNVPDGGVSWQWPASGGLPTGWRALGGKWG